MKTSPKGFLTIILTVWAAALLVATYVRFEKLDKSNSTKFDSRTTIFISIASYRDVQCAYTLLDAYKNAKHPERVFAGIVQQNDAMRDSDCLSAPIDRTKDAELLIKYKDNMRIHRVDHNIAKGPTWARHLVIDKLFRGEDFVFQIDSHSRFVPNWDELLVENVSELPPKSAISHYPSVWDPVEHKDKLPPDYNKSIARMCKGFYNPEGILQPVCGLMSLLQRKSVPAHIAGAGMTFYPGSVHKDMDMDPHLPYLFQGEELLFTMRMISKGYKVYSPRENYVFHYYGRQKHAKFFDLVDAAKENQRLQSLQRAKYIMGIIDKSDLTDPKTSLIEIEKYNIDWSNELVKKRMDHYFKMFGMDLRQQKMGDFCGQDDLSKWPRWDVKL
ncbi:hydroxyproline N-acetylglucosaminyltransferase [Acrasis kona]|uniref:Hydroxyproline N-acetylglucosaminyltransferase n=1 Tax=Acrasis kona TaxID=1008807 RepID=A0AAW2Z3Z1_9EUKA